MRELSTARTQAVRAIAAALAGSVLAILLASIGLEMLAQASAWPAPDRWVAVAFVCLGAVSAAALAIGCWLLAASALAGFGRAAWCRRMGARLTPALLRRAVGLTVGAGISVSTLGGIAVAAETDLGWEVTTQRSITDDPVTAGPEVLDTRGDRPESAPLESTAGPAGESGGVPDAVSPHAEQPADKASAGAAMGGDGATVTVQRGDSLWRIAARHLGSGASDAEIAATWPLWYEANRTVIGSDPGLIHPGQVLVPPDTAERAL